MNANDANCMHLFVVFVLFANSGYDNNNALVVQQTPVPKWPRSSTDRTQDCGSCNPSSILGGVTKKVRPFDTRRSRMLWFDLSRTIRQTDWFGVPAGGTIVNF